MINVSFEDIPAVKSSHMTMSVWVLERFTKGSRESYMKCSSLNVARRLYMLIYISVRVYVSGKYAVFTCTLSSFKLVAQSLSGVSAVLLALSENNSSNSEVDCSDKSCSKKVCFSQMSGRSLK